MVNPAPAQDITVFDREQVKHNRKRAHKNFQQHSFLFEWANEQIAERLSDVKRDFPLALSIGSRGETIQSDKIQKSLCMDITNSADVWAEEELLPFADDSFDLITSNLALHTVNDLPGALVQINKSLKPDGLFVAAMLGGETLHELRTSMGQAEIEIHGGISPRVAPFADKQQMGALLQRGGFALPVVDSDLVTVTYENIFKLMHDLRGMGEGNAIVERSRKVSTKSLFVRAAEIYRDNFSEPDGRIRATFEVIFLLGWAPHDSQQKPLRPGSAKNSLADALNTEEISTGEKAKP